jgi:hypothetical protein
LVISHPDRTRHHELLLFLFNFKSCTYKHHFFEGFPRLFFILFYISKKESIQSTKVFVKKYQKKMETDPLFFADMRPLLSLRSKLAALSETLSEILKMPLEALTWPQTLSMISLVSAQLSSTIQELDSGSGSFDLKKLLIHPHTVPQSDPDLGGLCFFLKKKQIE